MYAFVCLCVCMCVHMYVPKNESAASQCSSADRRETYNIHVYMYTLETVTREFLVYTYIHV